MSKENEPLFNKLTIDEKAQLCGGKDFWHLHGVERLNLPSIMVTDGPHGLRKQPSGGDHVGVLESVPATCFPTASALAATWNVELIEQMGEALARECLAEQVSVLLGPGANIKRHPLGGRNFEYFSEDPHLTGAMASAWIKGLQSNNVGASLKHYALNNHERGRMVCDVVVDERALREIYLPGWETPVKQTQPWTIMCAYNKFRGTYLSEHEYLLKTVLRDEFGFNGVVVTDWGANHKRVDGIKNGQSLEMPSSGTLNKDKIVSAIADGTLTEDQLDESVRPVVELILKAAEAVDEKAQVDFDSHHALARTVAEEASVLLKNDGILPLSISSEVLLVGALAQNTRYQGSGSSQIVPTRLEQPLEQIRAVAGEETEFTPGYLLSGEEDSELIEAAVSMAANAEHIIVIVGLTPEYESEGFDRDHMQLPANQLALLEALEPYHDRLVVVLQNGAPVELPFRHSAAAILEAYLGGQAGASALARILFGLANPSGKLAETLPISCTDVPSDPWFNQNPRQSQYRESVWVGYRYFATTNTATAYPFGHGLSYTEFELTNLGLSSHWQAGTMEGHIELTLTVRNIGHRAGAETVQVYVGQQNPSVPRPARELKAFQKVHLEANASQELTFVLNPRSFAFWCTQTHSWVVESDHFEISIGTSVADIRLSETLALNTGRAIAKRNAAAFAYVESAVPFADQEVFEQLLGHPIPSPLAARPFQMNSTLLEIGVTRIGRFVRKVIAQQIGKMAGGDNLDEHSRAMIQAIVNEMPIRSVVSMSEGKVSESVVRRLIHAMNGNWIKALRGAPVRSE